MELNKIYLGDNIEILKTLPDKSVNCCITSPPYYGLRDYGTGTWVGGDPNCKHFRESKHSNIVTGVGNGQDKQWSNGVGVGDAIYKTVCPICGAVREDRQVGLEESPEEYIDRLVKIFREVRRVLTDDGTLWVNIGDTYYGSGGGRGSTYHDARTDVVQSGNKGFNDMLYAPVLTKKSDIYKPKDLIGIPWMLAFALRADGWYLRQDIIWHKPNPMPESVKDRCTKSHEYIFLLSKNRDYYFDYQSIQERATYPDAKNIKFGGNKYGDNDNSLFSIYSGNEYMGSDKRNKRDVWNYDDSKYSSAEQEASVRQGMSKDRGNNTVAIRKNLPEQEVFVDFMRARTSVEALVEGTDIKQSTIEHWFRRDDTGFSYPSVEDWNKIKDLLNDSTEEFIKMDSMLTDVTYETDAIDKNNNGKRAKRDVWSVSPAHSKLAHFATFPEDLILPMILAGCPKDGVVLDPFMGSGTVGVVAKANHRNYVGIDLSKEYVDMANRRLSNIIKKLI